MSQKSEYDISEYRTSASTGTKTADVAGGEHPIAKRFGTSVEEKEFKFEADIMAERIADWYDDPDAALREYLSNAETAEVRRATMELQNGGYDVPTDVQERLEKAKEECGYEPVIEVTYNRKPDQTRLTIADNGCGITPTEYQVLRNIGYSTSHEDGTRLGQFGMGVMSFLNLVGTDGAMVMETRSFPSDDRAEESYALAMYATNMEYLDGGRGDYGTTFSFPAFSEMASQKLDVRNSVEKYCEGMRVPVIYREKDESGQEVYNEDYLPRDFTDDYPADAMVITYENEFFEAVMSNRRPMNNRDLVTYNVSVPIRRNFEVSNHRRRSSFDFDFRGKTERGPIVECDSDTSLIGLSPVPQSKYDEMAEERRDSFIPIEDVPSDAIVMPAPASSRDSYEGGHGDFWQHVAEELERAFAKEYVELLKGLDSPSDVRDLDSAELELLYQGQRKQRPKKKRAKADISDYASKVADAINDYIRHVPRDSSDPTTKRYTKKVKSKTLLKEARGGDIYVGKTVSNIKADIAWGLDDKNVVARIDDDFIPRSMSTEDYYDHLQELWGMKLLKELPSRNLADELPELDDAVIKMYEQDDSSSGGNSSGRNPASYRVRYYNRDNNRRHSSKTAQAKDIYNELDSGGKLGSGYRNIEKLVVKYEGDNRVNDVRSIASHKGVGVALVPRYVKEYLSGADNIYTSISELVNDQQDNIEITDDVTVADLTGGDLLVIPDNGVSALLKDDHEDEVIEFVEDETGKSFDRLLLVKKETVNAPWAEDTPATIVSFQSNAPSTRDKYFDSCGLVEDIIADRPIDWGHELMRSLRSGHRHSIQNNPETMYKVLKYLDQRDAIPTK